MQQDTWLDETRLWRDVGYPPSDRPERAVAGSLSWLRAGIDQ